MSILLKNLNTRETLYIYKVLSSAQSVGVRKCHWYPDYTPGPYPKTIEERKEAAAKYNLLPEEYEPYPDNEDGCGDYPKLPLKSVDEKDPWYPWDNPILRKNFNEPVHIQTIHFLSEGISTKPNHHIKYSLIFFTYIVVSCSILYLLDKIPFGIKKSERQFPTPGVVHYTFDLVEKKEKKEKETGNLACN